MGAKAPSTVASWSEDQRMVAESHRLDAESSRNAAEQFRRLAEDARGATDAARKAVMDAVRATADTLQSTREHMTLLERYGGLGASSPTWIPGMRTDAACAQPNSRASRHLLGSGFRKRFDMLSTLVVVLRSCSE